MRQTRVRASELDICRLRPTPSWVTFFLICHWGQESSCGEDFVIFLLGYSFPKKGKKRGKGDLLAGEKSKEGVRVF